MGDGDAHGAGVAGAGFFEVGDDVDELAGGFVTDFLGHPGVGGGGGDVDQHGVEG